MEIKLTNSNKVTLIDDTDYSLLIDSGVRCWHLTHDGYVRGCVNGVNVFMHRMILNPGKLHTDHINGNKLDNRKSNLRKATRSQNMANRKPNSKGTSEYKGVYKNKSHTWTASIWKDNHKTHIGSFMSEEDAAKAYDFYAKAYFGEFAKFNFQPLCRRVLG